jgi:NADH-quinone oxidoreductase subunit C
MTNEELKQYILSVMPDSAFEEGKQFLSVTIPSGKILQLSDCMKKNPALYLDYLFCVTGVDWTTHYTVVYHLTSTVHKHSLVVKAKIDDHTNPAIDTVYHYWRTAEFHEREIYDLLGIRFNNHPDLRRILLEDDWKGYPLRKDYTDDVNIVELE